MVTRAAWGSLYWIIAEDYEGTHKEFEYALQMFTQLGAVSKSDVSMPLRNAWRMRLSTGQVIETKTGYDIAKIRSDAPDGILLVEGATVTHGLFLKCFGRLSETHGWIVVSGTFEGSSGWYPKLFNDMQSPNEEYRGRSFSLPTWSNHVIFPGGRSDPEILRLERVYNRVPGMFEERVAGVPVPSGNLVFKTFRKHIHCNEDAVYRPGVPVYLGVDPSDGGHPYAVVACQFAVDPRRDPDDPIDFCDVIGEVWERGVIDEEVIEMCMKEPWWKDVRGGAIDVNAPDSRRRWATMAGVVLRADKMPQLAGIRRLHSFLHYKQDEGFMWYQPHLRVHPLCNGLVYEFGQYKRKDSDVENDELPPELPPANQPNDALKALWYLLVARYGYVKGKKIPAPTRGGAVRTLLHGVEGGPAQRVGAAAAADRVLIRVHEKGAANAAERRRNLRTILKSKG